MDFSSLLTDYGVSHHTSGKQTRRGWLNFRCPFCMRDPYMGYNVNGRYVSCWNCGRHPLAETIHLLTGIPSQECFRLCKELPRLWQAPVRRTGRLTLPDGIEALGHHHLKYLRGRRLDPSVLKRQYDVAALGCNVLKRVLRWRLFLPVHLDGQVVSWTTRTIGEKVEPRYFSAEDSESIVSIKDCLYGIDHVRNTVVVVEGPLDALRIGFGAVATLGTDVSPAQRQYLSRFPRRVVCFDNEPDAQRRARKLCDDLSVFDGVTYNVTLETGKDAGEASKGEIESLRREYLNEEV